jgi:hypothetical protein
MRQSALAIATTVAVLVAAAPADAGVTAVFGGLRPTVSAADGAVCATPPGGLFRLETIAGSTFGPRR